MPSERDELIERIRTTLTEHGGMSDLLPTDEFDCCVEEIVDKFVMPLQATILEYEHALEHTADKTTHINYDQSFCEDCANLAQSALDGVNRQDFTDMLTDNWPDETEGNT